MKDLITRLEAASVGSRELDREIAAQVGTIEPAHTEICRNPEDRCYNEYPEWWPNYTTSLDAAVTLVPEGYLWRVWNLPGGTFRAEVGEDMEAMEAGGWIRDAAMPALALSAASLKARSS